MDTDQSIKEFEQSKVKWLPKILQYMRIKDNEFMFYTIRGPRQVGKTTSIKLSIWSLLREGVPPIAVFFWQCDNTRTQKKLVETVEAYLDYTDPIGLEKRYLFLDEITSVKGWYDAVKYLFDTSRLQETSVVLNGSHAMDIEKGKAVLVGRTGKDPDPHKMFVPMKFAEFASCISPGLWGELVGKGYGEGTKRRTELMNLIQGKSRSLSYDLLMRKEKLDVCLDKYLLCGGVPRAINDFMTSQAILPKTYDDYVDALKGDLAHWKKDDQLSREILDEVIRALGSQLSWNGLSSRLVCSQPTIRKYVETLEHCFVLTYFHRTISLTKPKRARGKTNKKVFFEDPFLFHCARHWVMPTSSNSPYAQAIEYLADPSNKGRLIENVVGNHLIRLMFDLAPSSGFQYNANIFYYMENRRELDFMLNVSPSPIPIEVKYQANLKSSDYDFLLKVAAGTNSKGLMISRDAAGITEDVVTIPVSLFLFLI